MISLDRCNGSSNLIDNFSTKIRVSSERKGANINLFKKFGILILII